MDEDLYLAQWPADRLRPTEEQMKEAGKRLDEETRAAYKNGYEGDYGMSLEFTMGTYNREVWWHLFFPEEKYELTLENGNLEWKLGKNATTKYVLRGRGF